MELGFLTFALNIFIIRQTGVLKQQFTEEYDLLEEREGVESRKEKKKTVVTSNCVKTGLTSWPGEDSRVEIVMGEGKVLFIPNGDRKESESV